LGAIGEATSSAWQTGFVAQQQADCVAEQQGGKGALHPTAQRVQEALASLGSRAKVVEVPTSARTATEAASSLGTKVGQIVKSLVFVADGEPVLLLVAGDRRVDLAKAAAALGVDKVVRAQAEVVREATGFAIGGVPPVGHSRAMTTLVDQSLARFEEVWAAAGTPNAVFPTTPQELLRLSRGTFADLTVSEG
jgi:Cys-tRNA(Pro) deacylase